MIRSAAVAVLVGSVMIMLGACTTVRPPVNEPSPVVPPSTEPPVYAGPGQPDLKADRVWSSVMKDTPASVIALRDDSVVMTDGAGGVLAVGADGRKRWGWSQPKTLKLSEKLPEATLISDFGRSVDPGTSQVIVAAYQSHGERECWSEWKDCGYDTQPHLGLAALSADDGTPVWSTKLEPALPSGADPAFLHYTVKAVTGTVALVEINAELYDKNGKPLRVPLTVALDVKTGDQLWAQRGLQADWASGDRVLARRVARKDAEGTPEVLDARTGQRVWTATEPGAWQFWTLPQDLYGYGVVATRPSGSSPKLQVIDLTSGRPIPDATARHGSVAGKDGRAPFLAHLETDLDDRYTLVTAELPGGTGHRGEHRLPIEVTRNHAIVVAGGYLWLHHPAEPQRTMAIDRTGAQRLKTVPGRIDAVNEKWLVTAEGYKFTIYRLS